MSPLIDGWVELRAGQGEAVLGLDYGLTRAESTLVELVELLELPGPLWAPDYREWTGPGVDVSAHALVDRWARCLDAQDVGVAGVFGYCAGATLAQALAMALAAHGRPGVPVLLFDPQIVTAGILYDCFATAVRGLSTRNPDEVTEALHNGLRLTREPTGRRGLAVLAAGLTEQYLVVLRRACADRGLPVELEHELAERLRAFLRYLALAAELPIDAGAGGVAFVSDDFESPDVFQPRWRIGVPHVALLRSVQTAGAVRQELGSRGRPGGST